VNAIDPRHALPPIIRRATAADERALGRLGALLVETHYAFDAQRFIAPTPETPVGYGSWLASQVAERNIAVIVAEADGEVIGYAYAGLEGRDYMSLRGPAGVLYDIIVDPAHRGHGVGRQLLDAVLDFFRERNAPRVVLSTAKRNGPAQHLFASAGFRRTMIEMTRELGDTPA
jgi:ribosomal protein S18 acetylase RimI-like enzyme